MPQAQTSSYKNNSPNAVSVEGRDLIEKMLVADPSKRIGPSEALRHPWITRRMAPPQNDGHDKHADH